MDGVQFAEAFREKSLARLRVEEARKSRRVGVYGAVAYNEAEDADSGGSGLAPAQADKVYHRGVRAAAVDAASDDDEGYREIYRRHDGEGRAEAYRYVAPRVLKFLREVAYHLPAEKGEEEQRHHVGRRPDAARREGDEVLRAHAAKRRNHDEEQYREYRADDAELRPSRYLYAVKVERDRRQHESARRDMRRARAPAE